MSTGREVSKKSIFPTSFDYLILGLALWELAFPVFESRTLDGVLIGILRCRYMFCSVNIT